MEIRTNPGTLIKKQSHISRWRHLENFKDAIRGRRGTNPPELKEENEWWALGQHQGLATPLLDWTRSPFIAAYFAFIEESDNSCDKRAIWGLSQITVCSRSYLLEKNSPEGKEIPKVEIVDPDLNDNPRQLSQRGLFTRSPDGVDIESWIRENCAGEDVKGHLIKITIPEEERDLVLKSLSRMNINPLTLFPDLYGASLHSNLQLLIKSYW